MTPREIREWLDESRARMVDYNAGRQLTTALIADVMAAHNIIEAILPQLIGYAQRERRLRGTTLADTPPPEVHPEVAAAIQRGDKRAVPGILAELARRLKQEQQLGVDNEQVGN